jgi:hypothetical protein
MGERSTELKILYKGSAVPENPDGGEIFCNHPHQSWGPPSLLYKRYRFSFVEVK